MSPDPRLSPLYIGPLYIGSEIYRGSTYGPKHPLAIPRVSTTTDLCRALGWLPDEAYLDAPMASVASVTRFHAPNYVAALQRAEARFRAGLPPDAEDRSRHAIGAEGNPVYREIYRRPMISAGGMMLAARLTADGGIVHCPGGGTHHGRPARASGFCYLNDPVLGILAWRALGLSRIAYLDIDAHHGDGVEAAFADEDEVLTISVHEAGRWPGTGLAHGRAALNFPVPRGLNDSEMRHLLHVAILPAILAHRPQAILLQCGADALEEDPLARLSLSNNAHREVASALASLARPAPHAARDAAGIAPPALVVCGGGGYNPYTVARCWALVWATLAGLTVPDRLPPAAEAVLASLRYNRAAGRAPPAHWTTTLRDAPREGMVRDEVRRLAAGIEGNA